MTFAPHFINEKCSSHTRTKSCVRGMFLYTTAINREEGAETAKHEGVVRPSKAVRSLEASCWLKGSGENRKGRRGEGAVKVESVVT